MAVFPAEFFTYSTQYPESGTRIQLGGSYQFDTLPDAPDQRIFTLSLQGMAYFTDAGGAIDAATNPDRNMAGLEAFYNTHKRATAFTFNHPIYGAISCKFLNPLKIPDGISGGGGNISTVSVELVEQP